MRSGRLIPIVLALMLSPLVASGCGGSSTGGSQGTRPPTPLEMKVAEGAGALDPTWVHCHATKHSFNGEPLASCSFQDGSGGCYDANTGKDLTVPARAQFNPSELPECWQ